VEQAARTNRRRRRQPARSRLAGRLAAHPGARLAQERLVAAVDALPRARRGRLASVLDALVQELAWATAAGDVLRAEGGEARLANV
jgi:hypothetical protein